jgi:TRAP-type C4-dicarboxylate transport system permease small subunit
MPLLAPKLAPAGRAAASLFLRLVLCLSCLAISLWGTWVCRALVHSSVAGPYAGPNRLVGVVGWLVLFGPFAGGGGYGLMRTWRHLRRAQTERRSTQPVQIISPAHHVSAQRPSSRWGQITDHAITQPLDDATRQNLDQLAARAARITGIVVGILFLGAGLAGFLLSWIQGHRPSDALSALNGGLTSFRLTIYFLVGCGISVLLGAFILRETLTRPRTGWLVPLQTLNAVVGRKVSADEQNRNKLPGKKEDQR